MPERRLLPRQRRLCPGDGHNAHRCASRLERGCWHLECDRAPTPLLRASAARSPVLLLLGRGTLSCPSATACAGAYSFFDGEDDLLGAIYSITSATNVPSAVLTQVVVPSTTTETYTATANGASITVSIPPGAFGTQTVELAVTQPTLHALVSALSGLGLSGNALVTGIGVDILDPGTGLPVTGSFAVPITVTIRSTAITSSSKVVEFPASGSPFIDANAEVTSGEATVVVSSDPTLAIVNPSVVVPATHTGEPWAGSVAWWAMASLLAEARRRSAHARHRSQDRLPRYGL
jgi:hypothetical protein